MYITTEAEIIQLCFPTLPAALEHKHLCTFRIVHPDVEFSLTYQQTVHAPLFV